MLFNSYTFLVFFLVVIGLHYAPFPWTLKKFNLLVASYLFYAAWNPPFIVLLWISTVMDWWCAKLIYRARTPLSRRLMLCVTLFTNLGMLGFFKYGNFLLENFVAFVRLLGIDYHPAAPDIILPAGISFYTFVTLSYTLDVYRGISRPATSFLDYALFVTFFPHLVAGPIIRDTDFLWQCKTSRQATMTQFGWGSALMIVGLFQKVVVADGLLAPVVEKVYEGQDGLTTLDGWTGTLAFAGQIFCDFSGYSTCAIGAAMCLGFWLPENFRQPYAAIGFSDFWQRWHITLSSWLRDYLYIPLGGNRKGTVRTYVNLMTTMLLGGLWHGASWTFVVWGGMHGGLLCVERWLRKLFPGDERRLPSAAQVLLSLVTFAAVCFTWVFFRSHTFTRAAEITLSMVGFVQEQSSRSVQLMDVAVVGGVMALLLMIHRLQRSATLAERAARVPWFLRSAALACMMVIIVCMPGEDRAFIYFQF